MYMYVHFRWPFGDAGCVYSGFTATQLALTEINTLVGISVYRYIIVCKPKYRECSPSFPCWEAASMDSWKTPKYISGGWGMSVAPWNKKQRISYRLVHEPEEHRRHVYRRCLALRVLLDVQRPRRVERLCPRAVWYFLQVRVLFTFEPPSRSEQAKISFSLRQRNSPSGFPFLAFCFFFVALLKLLCACTQKFFFIPSQTNKFLYSDV